MQILHDILTSVQGFAVQIISLVIVWVIASKILNGGGLRSRGRWTFPKKRRW
jgi:hypothetical protein